MTIPLAESVAEEVRAVMARRRMSGQKLARLIGKSQAYLGRRLSGEVAFNVSDLEQLAGALEVPVAHFLPEPERAA